MSPVMDSKTRGTHIRRGAASTLWLCAALFVVSGSLAAQGNDPSVRISIVGGRIGGIGELWGVSNLPKIVQEIDLPARPPRRAQYRCPVESTGVCRLIVSLLPAPPACVRTQCVAEEAQWDTLRVRQFIDAGWTISVATAFHLSGPVFIGGTLAVNLLNSNKVCVMEFVSQIDDGSGIRNRDTNPNPSNCTTVDTQDGTVAVVDLMPFVQINFLSLAYLRINAGASVVPNTTNMRTQFRTFVDANNSGGVRPTFQISLGFEPKTEGGDFKTVFGFKRHSFDNVISVAPGGSAELGRTWHNQFIFLLGFSFTLID